LRLEVRIDNKRAIALYEKNGYARFDEIEDYYEDGATAVRMEKGLR
jgi:ribosomal protein S18 acetylase RimI-like enzyme